MHWRGIFCRRRRVILRVQVSTDRKPAINGRRKDCGACFQSIYTMKVPVHKIHSWCTICFLEFSNCGYLIWTEMQQFCYLSPISQCRQAGAWTKFYALSESTECYQWFWSHKIRTPHFTHPFENAVWSSPVGEYSDYIVFTYLAG